jgi:putative transposase
VAQKNLSNGDIHERRKQVDSGHHGLSVSRQSELLGLLRFTHDDGPTPVRESTLGVMARIDAHYLEDPWGGSHRMASYLARAGILISRDRVRNLRRCTGSRALDQKPLATVRDHPAEYFSCIVDLNQVVVIDQVWAIDTQPCSSRSGLTMSGAGTVQ